MMRVGLFVELTARPGKEDAVAAFLAGAREAALEESQTLAWFAFHLEGSRFAIFDCFDNDTGRNAHLSGPIAAALTAHADELLAEPPAIRRVDLLADTLDRA